MYKSDPIFVKPYVKEYLIKNFGDEIIIPEDNFIMCAFRICAERKKRMYDKMISRKKETKNFGDDSLVPICFTLTGNTYRNHGYYLTPTEEMHFRAMLEQLVKEKVNNAYDISKTLNPELTTVQALDIFRKTAMVSEESFSHDALVKYIYRRNKRKQTKQADGINLFNYDNKAASGKRSGA